MAHLEVIKTGIYYYCCVERCDVDITQSHQTCKVIAQKRRYFSANQGECMGSIISNCTVLQSTWDDVNDVVPDAEMKARIHGVTCQMNTFRYRYGLMLG